VNSPNIIEASKTGELQPRWRRTGPT